MLEHTRKRPIKISFTGPPINRHKAIQALKKLGYVESVESVPWIDAKILWERISGLDVKEPLREHLLYWTRITAEELVQCIQQRLKPEGKA